MTVLELINKLEKYDKNAEVLIRFALDEEDEIGYIFKTVGCYEYLDDRLYIIGEDVTTSEEYTSVGQFDLKELYKKAKEELLKGE